MSRQQQHNEELSLGDQVEQYVRREDLLDQSWIWHVPEGRAEAFAIGLGVSGLAALVTAAVWLPALPWWAAVLAAGTVVAPMAIIAAGMAVRALWTGAGPLAAAAATPPALAWLAAVSTAHLVSLPPWGQWAWLAVYAAVSVGTLFWWHQWTARTRAVRRRIRWLRQDMGRR